MGIKHKGLQKALVSYMRVENVDLLTNGHTVIELSLQALNLQREVITTPFIFASTTHAIVHNGLTPVFCDVDSETFTMDTTKLEELINDKPVQFFQYMFMVMFAILKKLNVLQKSMV